MRRDKTFARILLIFSIAQVVLAAPAFVRQTRIETNVQNEPVSSLMTASGVPETPPPPSQATSLHEPPAGSEQDSAHGSPAGSSHEGEVKPAAPPTPPDELPQDSTTPRVSVSQDSISSHDAEIAPWSGRPALHNVPPYYSPPPLSWAPPSQRLGSWAPPSLAGSGVQSKFWNVPLGDSPPPSGSGAHSYNNPATGVAQLHDNPPSSPPWWRPSGPVKEIVEAPSSVSSLQIGPETLETPRMSGVSITSEWAKAHAAADLADAKLAQQVADAADAAERAAEKAKRPKGLCGLRCWMHFYPRSFKTSPESDHWQHFSWD